MRSMIAVVAVVVAVGLGAGARAEDPPAAAPVRFTPAVGSFKARRTTEIASQVSGRVQEVLADVGDRVTKDQVLVRLDPTFFAIEVRQREADVAAARAANEDASLMFERMKNLWESSSGQTPTIAKRQLDEARTKAAGAAARVTTAEELLKYAQERLRETEVRAPYDAVVTQRYVHPGASVTSPPVVRLLEVQETQVLHLEFALPQALLARARPGLPVEFSVEGERDPPARAEVAVIFPVVDEATRTFRCRVVVDNAAGRWRPGVLADVRALGIAEQQ
jgi:membrane fusion protein (multidrug efflux system)